VKSKPTPRPSKRHAKTTALQLAQRIYRRQIAESAERARQFALLRLDIAALLSGQEMLSQRMESLRVVAEHCNRLIKEKEILQRRLDTQAWVDTERAGRTATPAAQQMSATELQLRRAAAYMSHSLADSEGRQYLPMRTHDADEHGKILGDDSNWNPLAIPADPVATPAPTFAAIHDQYVAEIGASVRKMPCAFQDTHRSGVPCAVCDYTGAPEL